MDAVRSRPVFWSAILVINLIVLGVLFYSIHKWFSDTDTKYIEETPSLTSYNPLEDEGFRRATDWSDFRSHGSLSASAADFRKGEGCRRVVVFLGRGAVLGHILTACDSLEPSMGLLMVDDILYYYGRAMETQGPVEETFMVAKKIIGERKCLMTNYTVTGDDRPKIKDQSESRVLSEYEDNDCKILLNFKMPPMLLLSRNGITGRFTPGKVWATINPWEPLGVVTRMYWYGARCFRLLVITSYGRSVQAVKVSCGPVENLVVTDNALYYGDALVVRRTPEADTFIIVYNPKRSGDCFKQTMLLSSREGRSVVSVVSKGNLSNQDKECQNLVNREITGAVVDKAKVALLVSSLQLDGFGVELYGVSLKYYEPYSQWSYFNLPMDLGFAVRYYKTKQGLAIRKLLLAVAKGVPVAATLVEPAPLQRLVMRGDALYYNTTIMLRKTKDENKFTALFKIDEYNCLRKSYLLKNENGVTVKEELPSGGEVTISMDEDCLDLIQGRKLKNAHLGNFGHETDEFGVPTELPEGVGNDPGEPRGEKREDNKPT